MSAPRLHARLPYVPGAELALPPGAARHAQVLRLQPGAPVVLFAGDDDLEWPSVVTAMRRDGVDVRVGPATPVGTELSLRVTLAVAMPANDRMDALVEKATELGVARIVPLMSARSVLRLEGDRAAARQARWQAIAVAASEQCGRVRVPEVALPATLSTWLGVAAATAGRRWLLDPLPDAEPVSSALSGLASLASLAGEGQREGGGLVVLSGPEGGFDPHETASARAAGYAPVNLGPRVLRADTAPLAALAVLALLR